MSTSVHHARAASPRLTRDARSTWPRMLRALVRRGLRDERRAVLTWGGALGTLCAFMAAIYPSIQQTIEEVAKTYPSGLREAFGVQAMNTVEGYIHAEMFSLIVPLAIGYFAIHAIASATVSAEERGELDTVLALPLARRALMTSTYLVMALVVAAIMAITAAATLAAGVLAGTGISAGLVAAGAFGVWPLAMFFGGVATVSSGAFHSSRTVVGVGLSVVVAMYALDLVGRLAHGLEPLRWVSAFRYYGAPMRDGIDLLPFLGLTLAGAVLLVAGTLLFERRDIRN